MADAFRSACSQTLPPLSVNESGVDLFVDHGGADPPLDMLSDGASLRQSIIGPAQQRCHRADDVAIRAVTSRRRPE